MTWRWSTCKSACVNPLLCSLEGWSKALRIWPHAFATIILRHEEIEEIQLPVEDKEILKVLLQAGDGQHFSVC